MVTPVTKMPLKRSLHTKPKGSSSVNRLRVALAAACRIRVGLGPRFPCVPTFLLLVTVHALLRRSTGLAYDGCSPGDETAHSLWPGRFWRWNCRRGSVLWVRRRLRVRWPVAGQVQFVGQAPVCGRGADCGQGADCGSNPGLRARCVLRAIHGVQVALRAGVKNHKGDEASGEVGCYVGCPGAGDGKATAPSRTH